MALAFVVIALIVLLAVLLVVSLATVGYWKIQADETAADRDDWKRSADDRLNEIDGVQRQLTAAFAESRRLEFELKRQTDIAKAEAERAKSAVERANQLEVEFAKVKADHDSWVRVTANTRSEAEEKIGRIENILHGDPDEDDE